MSSLHSLLLGAIAMACMVAALFFLRFWSATRDRFFLFFAASFFLEGCNRVVFWRAVEPANELGIYYVLRLIAYALIVIAIWDKNRPTAR